MASTDPTRHSFLVKLMRFREKNRHRLTPEQGLKLDETLIKEDGVMGDDRTHDIDFEERVLAEKHGNTPEAIGTLSEQTHVPTPKPTSNSNPEGALNTTPGSAGESKG